MPLIDRTRAVLVIFAVAAIAIALAVTTVSSVSFSSGSSGENPSPGRTEARASTADLSEAAVIRVAEREEFSVDDLRVLSYSPKHMRLSRVTAHRFKVIHDVNDRVHLVVLNEAGEEVDLDQLLANERAAYADAYGKLSQELFRRLQSAGSEELIHVWISVNVPVEQDSPPPSGATEKELVQFVRDQTMQQLEAWKPIVESVVQRVAQLAKGAPVDTYERWASTTLTPDAIKQVEAWDDVSGISIVQTSQPVLENARDTIDVQGVYKRHVGGWGVKVAINESHGGLISTGSPYLHADRQDVTYACTSDHTNYVAGIIRSSHIDHFGIAPGAELLVGGTCGGVLSEHNNLATWAISSGARVLNLSWGYTGDDMALDSNDQFYDSRVYIDRVTVVGAAGSNGDGAPCSSSAGKNVMHPHLAYNVITVGAFDDKNTPSLDDDEMWGCSSYKNPDSTSGDRIKPELVAPGVDIVTLRNSAPWTITANGTSVAAPMVAAGAALLMQRTADLEDRPEAVKAILMATAYNNILGSARISSKDGVGGIRLQAADNVLLGTSGIWGTKSIFCSTSVPFTADSMALTKFKKSRVVIVWAQRPTYVDYETRPSADLDIYIKDSTGDTLTGSGFGNTFDNTYEIVRFDPASSGVYTLHVDMPRCSLAPNYLAWAWFEEP